VHSKSPLIAAEVLARLTRRGESLPSPNFVVAG